MGGSQLFDVVYACRYGNGNIASKDGSRYKGVGFIHLTWKDNFKKIYEKWSENNKGRTLTLDKFAEKMATDVDIAMEAAMIYWEWKKINDQITSSNIEDDVRKTGGIVNTGHVVDEEDTDEINGYDERVSKRKDVYKQLNPTE